MSSLPTLTQDESKNIVMQYKHNNDEESVKILVAQYDKLIVGYLYKYRKRYKHIVDEQMQDLYHLAISAMLQSFRVFPDDMESRWLPGWILAYVKAALRKEYSYKIFEHKLRVPLLTVESTCSYIDTNIDECCAKIDLQSIFDKNILTEFEMDLIHRKFLKQQKLREIAEDIGVNVMRANYLISCALLKIRKTLGNKL